MRHKRYMRQHLEAQGNRSVLVRFNFLRNWGERLLFPLRLTNSEEHLSSNSHASIEPFLNVDPLEKHLIEVMGPGKPADRVWQHVEPAMRASLSCLIRIIVKSNQGIPRHADPCDPATATPSTH